VDLVQLAQSRIQWLVLMKQTRGGETEEGN